MNVNDDFTKRASVIGAKDRFVPSPVSGVERLMLDRIGGEVARATSIVRFAPGSTFTEHTHGGGEEFLVLDGVFQDESGDFPAGSYVRNPPTTHHTPASREGCLLFVKLWQFDPQDRTQVRIDTFAKAFEPLGPDADIAIQPLFSDDTEAVALERWSADAAVQRDCPGGCELLVLDGQMTEGGDVLTQHDWLRLPAGATLSATAGAKGCTVWIKTGHLRTVSVPPKAA